MDSLAFLPVLLLPTLLLTTVYARGSFDPHIHPPTNSTPRQLTDGFHSDVDDLSISAGFQHTCGESIGYSCASSTDVDAEPQLHRRMPHTPHAYSSPFLRHFLLYNFNRYHNVPHQLGTLWW